MEELDTRMAERVWQRVRSTGAAVPAIRPDTRELLFQSHSLAGIYLGLQRRLTGRANARIRELYRQHRELSACLKGMLLAADEPVPGLSPMEPGTGSHRALLQGCFHRERRLGDAFAGRTGDPTFGPIWQMLAGQSLRRAAAVLELLGEIQEQER